jgi:hypothetical protein
VWWALVNTVMNLRGLRRGIYWTERPLVAEEGFYAMALFHCDIKVLSVWS